MTVTTTTGSSGPFVGNGATTAFPFGFSARSTAEVQVLVNGIVAAGGFTVTLNADALGKLTGGGTVTFTTAPATGATVLPQSIPTFVQDVAFQNNGAFLPSVVEGALDQAARRDIYLNDRINSIPAIIVGDAVIASQTAASHAQDAATSALTSAGTVGLATAAIASLAAATAAGGSPARLLLGLEGAGVAIDATSDTTAHAAYVLDPAHTANNFDGSVRSLFPSTAWPNAKLVVKASGATEYSDHNLALYSSDLNNGSGFGKTGLTVASASVAPSTLAATKLTTTGTTAYINQSITGLVSEAHSVTLEAEQDTAGTAAAFLYVRFDTGYAYFNLATGAVGTVTAGLTAASSVVTTSTGKRWQFHVSKTSGDFVGYIGLADADNNPAVTSGKTAFIDKVRIVQGSAVLNYVATTSAKLADVPYDWSTGSRTIAMDPTDNAAITSAMFTYGAENGIYLDLVRTTGVDVPLTLYNAGGTQFVQIKAASSFDATHDLYQVQHVGAAGASRTQSAFGALHNERVEIELRYKTGDLATSFSGEPTVRESEIALAALDKVTLAESGSGSTRWYLRRLVVVPRSLVDGEIGQFRRQGNTVVVATMPIVRYLENFAGDGGDNNRRPCIGLLGQSGDVAHLICTSDERHTGVGTASGETPCRVRQRYFEFDRSTGILSSDGPSSVLNQPTGWSTHDGHSYGATFWRTTSGARKGRLWVVYGQLDNPTFAPDYRNLYIRYSDSNGRPGTWSAASKIADAGANGFIMTGANGNVVVYPDNHPTYPGRVVIPIYFGVNDSVTGSCCIYASQASDMTLAASWTKGAAVTGVQSGRIASEDTLALLNDDRLLMTIRMLNAVQADVQNERGFAFSSDGGASFAWAGEIPGYTGAAAEASTVQFDTDMSFGKFGSVGLVRARTDGNPVRDGALFSRFETDTMTSLDETYLLRPGRSSGYQDMVPLFGGRYLAHVVETPENTLRPDSFSTYLTIVRTPARAVRQ
jgi:hypothetical protein